LSFTLDRTHIKRAELKIKTRQWLMERLNSEEFGLRQFLDMTQSWENASDEDLIAGFRAAAEKAGLTAEDLVQWLEGLKRDRIYAP
jgi:hypothetical protein